MKPAAALLIAVILSSAAPVRADDGAASSAQHPELGSAPDAARRPPALTPLLASYAALQALDIVSTYGTPQSGGREANPVVRQALEAPAAVIAMKAGSTALTVAVVNRLSRKHPRAAVLLMIGMNSAYAAIVAHNYAVAR